MITDLHIEEFLKQAHRYGNEKLMLCSSGNLSWRIGDEALVSGTGSWVPNLQKEKVSICNIETGTPTNGVKPSMESTFHLGILRARPDVNVVLHFQSEYATAVACMKNKDPVFDGRYCCFIYVSAKILKEEPAKIAALLRAIHKAEAWIAEHPEETVDIIAEGKYSEIEDKPLAVELIKSYVYTSLEQRKTLGRDVKGDLRYFSEQLKKIGYLTQDPDQFVANLYEEVDLNK
mgnify:CR=1 FL=1